MRKFEKGTLVLLAAGIAAGVLFLITDRHADRGGTSGSVTTTTAHGDIGGAPTPDTSAAPGKPIRDLAAFKERLNTNLHRVMILDPSMSDQELYAFENELVAAAEFDPRARSIMIEELRNAFAQKIHSNIYLLERVLSVSDPGRKALSETYTDMVLAQNEDSDFYALQSLKGLQEHLPEERMGQLFDKALGQLDRYDSFARYSPAMTFAAKAIAEDRYRPSPAQKNALLDSLRRRQAAARDQQEQFFIAQSLIWMAEPAGRSALVERMLTQYPNRGTFSAVLESIKVGDFEPDARLMRSLEDTARRISQQHAG